MSYTFEGWSWAELERAINTHYFDEDLADQVRALTALAKLPGQKRHYLKKVKALLVQHGLD